ncbi:MAG: hotdog domain-containing protein [Candidatus Acidiferrales bacterium]|jgi:predicted thioesterase
MKPRKKKRVSKRAGKVAPKRPRKAALTSPEQRPRLGLEATVERVVLPEHTIRHINPNLPAVLSTPSMIGLMEYASVLAVLPELPPGAITVGTRIEVDHLKAVPPGAAVRAWAKLVEYRGRFLVFDVEARSGEHVIGRGRVFRAIVEPATHHARAQAQLQQ